METSNIDKMSRIISLNPLMLRPFPTPPPRLHVCKHMHHFIWKNNAVNIHGHRVLC